jgi:hypothetical protein
MSVRALSATSLLFAGCFSKPPAPEAIGLPADAAHMPDDAAVGADADALVPVDPCAPMLFDEMGPGCGTWATSSGAGTVTRSGGELVLGVMTGAVIDATCTAQVDVLFASVTVEVEAFASVANVDGNVVLKFADDAIRVQTQGSSGNRIAYAENQGSTYTLPAWTSQTRYVRLTNSGSSVALYLGDGTAWSSPYPIAIIGSMSTVRVALDARYVGAPSGPVTPASVSYDNLALCQ